MKMHRPVLAAFRFWRCTSPVSGGGSCTGFDAGLASECINYGSGVDFTNASAHCTAAGGSYGAGSCSTTSVQGRCTLTHYNGGGANNGMITYYGCT